MKRFFTYTLYNIILNAVRLLPARPAANRLLLIKTDEIGDYALFRHFLHYFRESSKYAGWHITLVGNKAWKQLYDALDKDTTDEVLWLDKTAFKQNPKYRFQFLRLVRQQRSTVVINAIFSRNLLIDDTIATAATGYKIAMESDVANRRKSKEADTSDGIYNNIISAGNSEVFDQVRNQKFLQQLLPDLTVTLTGSLPQLQPQPFIKEPYFILFIGAGHPERKWPLAYFAEVAAYVSDKYNLLPVLAGGPAEAADAAAFSNYFTGRYENLAGKTSLPQFLSVLHEARILLSVDTSAVHLAAMVGCPVVGLFSGKFHGRFAPYPTEITKHFYPVYPDFVDPLITSNDPVLYDTMQMKNDTAKMISPQKAIRQIDIALSSILVK